MHLCHVLGTTWKWFTRNFEFFFHRRIMDFVNESEIENVMNSRVVWIGGKILSFFGRFVLVPQRIVVIMIVRNSLTTVF